MKSIKFSLILALSFCYLYGMANVTFNFSARTIPNGQLKNSMEKNISALLTEINRAGNTGSNLDLSKINIESGAASRLMAFWNNAAHFLCVKNENIDKCLNDFQGYQVRNIPIKMKPVDNSYDQSLDRTLTISMNKNGVITGVRPGLEVHDDVSKILTNPGTVTDTRQRMEILKWVEDFRCYYNEKNANALDQIFSDDALIITGSVVKTENRGDMGAKIINDIKYKVQSKKEYIDNIKRVFQNNEFLKVEFDHISVVMHGAKKDIYGVTLHQKWNSSRYNDEGWLFLLWDFNDPEKPQIHVRTWQPEEIVSKHGTFTLDDFFIP